MLELTLLIWAAVMNPFRAVIGTPETQRHEDTGR